MFFRNTLTFYDINIKNPYNVKILAKAFKDSEMNFPQMTNPEKTDFYHACKNKKAIRNANGLC